MTMTSAATPASIPVVGSSSVGSTRRRERRVHFIRGINSFGGLKAQNSVTSLGFPVCTEQCFAKVVSSLKYPSKGRRGGAAASTCNAAAEIFQTAGIMNGLVLVGVAVGFVLLRIEAFVEETDVAYQDHL
ncbi:uncharacterized protein LOC108334719 isoform X2 [Vigna angularis]|uniref:uncharacterized protein LOC108334719 isoform X2 n=2 Tax=Phaseolus angularis TaxID=3914 RepID=UPI000809BB1E|nr:uncharacterized protein LOC108334719 isoform X2 [Vigna angularis]